MKIFQRRIGIWEYIRSAQKRERERVQSRVRWDYKIKWTNDTRIRNDACGGGGGPFDKGAGSEELEVEHLLQSPSIEYHRCGTYVIVVTLRACSRIITIFSSFTMTVSGASISWGSTYTWNDNETRNESIIQTRYSTFFFILCYSCDK